MAAEFRGNSGDTILISTNQARLGKFRKILIVALTWMTVLAAIRVWHIHRLGLPLSLLLWIAAVLVLPLVFPFTV